MGLLDIAGTAASILLGSYPANAEAFDWDRKAKADEQRIRRALEVKPLPQQTLR